WPGAGWRLAQIAVDRTATRTGLARLDGHRVRRDGGVGGSGGRGPLFRSSADGRRRCPDAAAAEESARGVSAGRCPVAVVFLRESLRANRGRHVLLGRRLADVPG